MAPLRLARAFFKVKVGDDERSLRLPPEGAFGKRREKRTADMQVKLKSGVFQRGFHGRNDAGRRLFGQFA